MKNLYLPKIIIDTDPGHDDALAIMLMVKSGLFDIKAITTVAGNSTIEKTTNNARYVIDLLGVDTPLFSGSEKPLERDLILANVHGKSGLDGAKIIKNEILNGLAIKKIIELAKQNPGEISILCLGPLTNIAKAFLNDPDLPKSIKKLVIMGGAIRVPGNKSRVAEFNMFVDPEAAKIVFDSEVEKILVPLDVCNEVVLFERDFETIKGELKKPILAMMKKFIKGIKRFEGTEGALVYDALAAYYLINPIAFMLKNEDIRIETKGALTAGMTILEKRLSERKQSNVNLAVKLDKRVFLEDFLRTLSN